MSPKTEDFKDVCHMTGCKTAKHHNNIPVTASFWSLTHPLFPLWAKVIQRPSDNDVFSCDKDTSFKCHRIIWFSSHICISHLSFHVDNLNKSVFCFHSLSSETGTLLFHVSCVCVTCAARWLDTCCSSSWRCHRLICRSPLKVKCEGLGWQKWSEIILIMLLQV